MITPAPDLPNPAEPTTFRTRAINLFYWIVNTFVGELETEIANVAAIGAAMNLNDTTDTSASSVAIGSGSRSYTVSGAKSFSPGMWLSIADTAAPSTNSMVAQVTSYDTGTGALVVNVPANGVFGSGTKTAWTISLTAAPSTQIAAHFVPVAGAVDMAASLTAMDVPSNAQMTLAIGAVNVAQIQPVAASVATSALTATINPTKLDFRSATLTSGTITTVSLGSAASLVVPSGATLGTTNSVAARLVVLAINNAGAIEPAIVNLAGGIDLSETGLISTTALSTGSDSANVVYSTTARTSVAYRVVGILDITQTTAGTWATAPALVQGAGGQSAAMSTIGFGQTWQNVAGSRAAGTTYYNTTFKPITVSVSAASGATGAFGITPTVGGVGLPAVTAYASAAGYAALHSFIVPPGASYSVAFPSSTVSAWVELS